MSDTTASAPTPKEDAAAKQSEQMSTGSQTVDNHLKAGSHASQAQVHLTAMHAGAALQEHDGSAVTDKIRCPCDMQAASDKADHDKSVAETGAKPMKREAEPQI